MSIGVGLLRLCFPESQQFIEAKRDGKKGAGTQAFLAQAGTCVKKEWKRIVYAVILMVSIKI